MVESDSSEGTAGQTLTGLTKALAARAATMRLKFVDLYARESPKGPLHAFVATLVANLVREQEISGLADQVAQAITCGLATVRAIMGQDDPFTPKEVFERLPHTHPILHNFFAHIIRGLAGTGLSPSEILPASLVEDLGVPALFQLLGAPWVGKALHEPKGAAGGLGHAIHLYESFLQAYNAEKRAQRGVFYTPDAIVSFIVQSVDVILRRDCGCEKGYLSLSSGHILDPATGTGTFLNQLVRVVKDSFDEDQRDLSPASRSAAWKDYVSQHLLGQIIGCEVLLAPFVVAHLLLGQTLEETGYSFDRNQRLGIFLTNAIDAALDPRPAKSPQHTLDAHLGNKPAGVLATPPEAKLARAALDHGQIHVILGNPPYARKSQNVSPAIMDLIAPYKQAVSSERNIQALSDDYLKFLRLAQVCIERARWGVVGFVLNNRFLTGGIFRGVRESLCQTFDKIYVLNLHGGKKGYEQVPAGMLDDNVFPIAQGVCICLLVKQPGAQTPRASQIFYHDQFGSQTSKLDFLAHTDWYTVPWVALPPAPPGTSFAPDMVPPALRAEWETFAPLEQLFSFYNVGGKPGDDDLLVSVRREMVIPKLETFLQASKGVVGNASPRLTEARQKILQRGSSLTLDASHVELYLYRPFDIRWVYYDPAIWTRGVPALKVQCRGTLLLLCAKIVNDPTWAHVFATTTFPDVIALSNSTSVNCYVFPVQISEGGTGKQPWNLTPAFQSYLTAMGMDLNHAGDADILAYLYAVLSAPTYRSRYDVLLRGGHFPRVPLVRDRALFARISTLGRRLVDLHASFGQEPTHLAHTVSLDIRADVIPGDCVASGFPRFEKNQILISQTAKFAPVSPEVWDFVVGKYPVCRQWLVARAKLPLSAPDIAWFLQLLGMIRDTIAITREIDAIILSGGNFPLPSVPLDGSLGDPPSVRKVL